MFHSLSCLGEYLGKFLGSQSIPTPLSTWSSVNAALPLLLFPGTLSLPPAPDDPSSISEVAACRILELPSVPPMISWPAPGFFYFAGQRGVFERC